MIRNVDVRILYAPNFGLQNHIIVCLIKTRHDTKESDSLRPQLFNNLSYTKINELKENFKKREKYI
jgi:hypothetical protein